MADTRKLALLSTGATFVLIALGGLVRATKSGLGCGTDWPDCSGRLVPAMENRAMLIEFSHRAAAGIVVVLLAWLAVVALRRHRSEPRILWGSLGAFGLVLAQAGLGALVVKLELHAVSVVLHLLVALSLLGLLVSITLFASTASLFAHPDRSLHRRALLAAGGVLVVMLAGSYVTGSNAGLVFPDWPLMGSELLPDLSTRPAAIGFLHRLLVIFGGLAVGAAALPLLRLRREQAGLARLGFAALGLYAVEIGIGAINVWTDLNSISVMLHLTLGAAIWGCLVTVALRTRVEPALAATRDHDRRAVMEATA